MRLVQLFPLNMYSYGINSSARLLKTVQDDSFATVKDAVPHWPRLDVCRPRRARKLNSRRLHCWTYTGGKIRRPALWSKGMPVSGSVLFRGLRGYVDQAGDVLFLPLPPCCGTVSQAYKRQEKNVFNHLLISFRAIAQDNEDNQTIVS